MTGISFGIQKIQQPRFALQSLLFFAFVFWSSIGSTPSFAQNLSEMEILKEAAKAQDAGQDAKATSLYEEVLGKGHINGYLFYNLGIAYYRTQRLGESVAAFLAAQRYLPRDPDVARNLKFVMAKISDKLEPNQNGRFSQLSHLFVGWLTKKEWLFLTMISALLASAVTMVGLLVSRFHRMARIGWFMFLLPLIFGFLLGIKALYEPRWGAIKSSSEAKVFSGPAENHTLLFSLRQGAPVFLAGEPRQSFLPIEISDGKRGWVSAKDVAFFGE